MSAFLIDPHVHTAETSPCGRLPAAELVRLYLRAGYDGIIVTDHYSRDFFGNGRAFPPPEWRVRLEAFLTGYRLAEKAGREAGLAVFLGMELKFNGLGNDYLVYGLDEAFLLAHPALHTLDLERFRGLAAGRGVLIVQAHPFREGCRPAPADLLDGLEAYNGNPRHESQNHLAARYAREHRLLPLSASDAHQAEDVGRGGMRFPARLESIHDFIAALADAEPCGAALDGSGPHPAVSLRRRA
jgi:predicted metal-dependent phosphoesterase TrpH